MPFPPPPPPPPPPLSGAPPPPPPALPAFGSGAKKANPGQARDQLLQSIRMGKPLKKTVTVDKSKPLINSKYWSSCIFMFTIFFHVSSPYVLLWFDICSCFDFRFNKTLHNTWYKKSCLCSTLFSCLCVTYKYDL
jgi:hypothetical protein